MFNFLLINSLRYLTFSYVRAVFGRSLPGFRSVANPQPSTRLQIAFVDQSFQPFSRNSATIVRYPKPSSRNVSIRALSSYDILPVTKIVGLTTIMTSNTEKCYVASNHINISVIMMSQQRWHSSLTYFNNKIYFLFSCEIHSWRLHCHQFDIRQVNIAQSNTLVHCFVPNKCANLGAKIFTHYWDIAIFVLEYFTLNHPVHVKVKGKGSGFI